MKGRVTIVGAGPGDPELLTVKGRRVLNEADVIIYAGSLVNPALVNGLNAETFDSAKLNLDEIVELMREKIEKGKQVVRLHSGDPSIYGAIKEQMVRLDNLGIPYEIIPGVSSAVATAAALKEEFTLPEVTQTLIITRLGGRTPVPEKEALRRLSEIRATTLIFLSVHEIEKVVSELLNGYAEDTPVAVVERVTWPQQRIIRGTLKDIAQKVRDAGIDKTAIIAVGDFMRGVNRESRLYDKGFSHGYRE
ncbi:MAG: precorrin-4 C(11)-methyltransferase [Thermodesulfobacteriota bacterium]|nr:precorrin-4 C(11)-methyltransferase [Thermodesulfobacteriota bacterium]